MISTFAALAEWPGAIKKLFRKTKGADEMPRSNTANEYTITLYDLESAPVAREVDVVVNERLAVDVDSGGQARGGDIRLRRAVAVLPRESARGALRRVERHRARRE